MAKYLRFLAHQFADDLRPQLASCDFVSGYIFDLFELELRKIPSREVVKLAINFTANSGRHLQREQLLDILQVDFFLDVSAFTQMSGEVRKEFFLNSILEVLTAFADDYGWDLSRCREVHQRILDGGIEFDRWWGKATRNRRTKHTAQCHVRYLQHVELSLGIRNQDGELTHKVRLATLPGTLGAITHACGKIEWLDESHVRLWQENQRDYWEFDIEAEKVSYHYPRAERGDPHGEYDLAQMYMKGYIVDQDEEQALVWLRRAANHDFGRAKKLLEKLTAATS